ncbi:hypothetical protein AMS68_000983 [Peltaster fructicola]|uniref:FAD-binding domain-containing protein n=1 Tax=Peltaster fructicola TaxID=286661 RepID=A0A6H0XL76_9PEZI|nr:hypothetical protein AMS68_000983 [Peltaster fructicola]
MTLKIAINGAGPAGCMLARLLTQSNKDIEVVIFEGEASLNFRSQGGTLDLRTGSGLDAIKAANLWEEFKPHARYDGEALKVADKNYVLYLNMNGSKEHKDFARPEIDRPALRKLLFESLPAGIVEWGHKLVKVDEDLTLHFANKPSRGGFDLIVGADGAWSKTRARISNAQPMYSGISGHQMTIPNAERDHKELYDRLNRGSIFSYSNGKSIMAQQMGDGTMSIGLWCVQPQNWQDQAPFNTKDNAQIQAAYAELYKDWDPRLSAYTQQADCDITARDLYMLPVGHKWEHVPGVTLIGDSASLSTPFAGIGVNKALQDALLLSQAILAAADKQDAAQALDQGVKTFEEDLFKRGKQVQENTYTNMQFMYFQEDAPRKGIEKFIINAVKDEMGWFTYLLAPLVYAYYFVFKLVY